MTITTGSFDAYGIPQGSRNRFDDMADVDVLEAKEGDTVQFRGGRWVPVDGNEVAIQPEQPQDLGVELWVDPTGATLGPQEVALSGPRHTTGVRFIEEGTNPVEQRYIGLRTTTNGTAGLGTFFPADHPTTPLTLTPFGVGTPSQAEHATTKQYVDGGGTINSVTGSIPSAATGMSHVATGPAGLNGSWGSGVAVTGSGIIVYADGYYRITCFGGFGTSGTGTIRMMQVVLYPSFGLGTNTNWIQTYSTPSANTTGFGAGLSCAGVYYLPANQIIVVRGRQDSGAALTLTATLTCERIPGAI